jgi:hypothetical protein
MDYRKRLQAIHAKAESEDRKKGEGIYYEEHHKIPAHYFANEQYPDGRDNPAANHPSNLVLLTAKEHYMAHRLLYKIDPCPANLSALVMMQRIKRGGKIYTVKGREAAAIKEAASKISTDNINKLWKRPGFKENQSRLRTERNYEPKFNKASSDLMWDRHHNNPQWQKDHREWSSKKMKKNHQTPDFIERRDKRGSDRFLGYWANKVWAKNKCVENQQQAIDFWKDNPEARAAVSARVKQKHAEDPDYGRKLREGASKYNTSPIGLARRKEINKRVNGDYPFENPGSKAFSIQEVYSLAPWVYKWWLSVNHLGRGSGRKAASSFFGYKTAGPWQYMVVSFRETGDALFNNAKWRERFENNPQFADAQQAAAKLVEDL